VTAEGTVDLPPGTTLWLIVQPELDEYWLGRLRPAAVDADGHWTARATLGRHDHDDSGHEYRLLLVVTTQEDDFITRWMSGHPGKYGPLDTPPDENVIGRTNVFLATPKETG